MAFNCHERPYDLDYNSLTRQPDRSGIRGAIVVETASASNTAGTPP